MIGNLNVDMINRLTFSRLYGRMFKKEPKIKPIKRIPKLDQERKVDTYG